jgi:NADPH2:quinone reductase
MKAILFDRHGGPEVLEYRDFPPPEPQAGEVLVRLRAAALNRLDLWVREGWPGIRLQYPHIPGADGAGEIAALGAGVSGWSPGERVAKTARIISAAAGICSAKRCAAPMPNTSACRPGNSFGCPRISIFRRRRLPGWFF